MMQRNMTRRRQRKSPAAEAAGFICFTRSRRIGTCLRSERVGDRHRHEVLVGNEVLVLVTETVRVLDVRTPLLLAGIQPYADGLFALDETGTDRTGRHTAHIMRPLKNRRERPGCAESIVVV